MSREHRIPLRRIRCMTTDCYEKLRKIWQIIKKICPEMFLQLVGLPPLMLDWLGPDYIAREQPVLKGVRSTLLSLKPKKVWQRCKEAPSGYFNRGRLE